MAKIFTCVNKNCRIHYSMCIQLCGEMQASKNYKSLLPKIISLMAHGDIGVKRIAYSAYAKHSHKVREGGLNRVICYRIGSKRGEGGKQRCM